MSEVLRPDDWPQGKFAAILADPPWHFSTWGERPWWHDGEDVDLSATRAADKHYDTMPADGILSLPVSELAAPDCCLFLWTCWPLLHDALRTIEAWGFSYKTEAFTWLKVLQENPREPRMGLGYWTRANTEPCLLATKGHPKRLHKDVGQVIAAPIREHSRKPDETHSRIERLVAGPYLELFARAPREGWTVWGNETGKFDELRLDMEVPL